MEVISVQQFATYSILRFVVWSTVGYVFLPLRTLILFSALVSDFQPTRNVYGTEPFVILVKICSQASSVTGQDRDIDVDISSESD